MNNGYGVTQFYHGDSSFGVPHVLRTVTGGSSWSSIDGIAMTGVPDIPAHWIAVRPCNSEQLYVGTELGLFVSEDAGETWAPANEGLAHTIVESLDFKNNNTLVAFTHGRGAFMAELAPCASCPADLNGDGTVAVQDLLTVPSNWSGGGLGADLAPPDDVIDVLDLLALLAGWGTCSK